MAKRNSLIGLQEFDAKQFALMQQHVINTQYSRLKASQKEDEKNKEIQEKKQKEIQDKLIEAQQQQLQKQQQQQQEDTLNIPTSLQKNQNDKVQQNCDQQQMARSPMTQHLTADNQSEYIVLEVQQNCDQQQMSEHLTVKKQTEVICSEVQRDIFQQQIPQHSPEENQTEHIDSEDDESGQKSQIIHRCLICNTQVWLLSNGVNNGAYDLFADKTRTSHRLFRAVEVLEGVLKEELVFAPLHSTLICKRCFNLIDEIDGIEVNLLRKREDLSSLYFTTKSTITKGQLEVPKEKDKATVIERTSNKGRSKVAPGKVMFDMRSGLLVMQKEESEEEDQPAKKVIHVYEDKTGINNNNNDDDDESDHDNGLPDYNTDEETHVEEDVQKERVICRLCGGSFKTVSHLNRHLSTHNASVYRCHYCNENFDKAVDLQTHMDQHVNENNAGKVNVDQGEKRVVANSNHKGSKKLTKNKPRAPRVFSCPICGKIFQVRKEVQDHRRIEHKGERPFECDICGNAFSQKGSLLLHKRITHLQERRFKCDFCDKTFKWKRHLVGHVMSIHTGERPYKCKHCDAAFAYPQHCRKHMRIHTGEKPFICNICGKTFSCSDNCSAHMFTHTNKKKFECLICSVGCMRKIQILDHIKSHGYTQDQNQYYKVNSPGNLHGEMGLLGSSRTTGAVSEQGQGANVRLTAAKIVRGTTVVRERKHETKHYSRTNAQLLTTVSEIDYRAASMPHNTIAAHVVLPASTQATTVNVPTNMMLGPTGHNTSHRNTGNNMEFYDMPMLFIDSDNASSRQASTYIVEEMT